MWSSHEITDMVAPRIPGECVDHVTRSNLGALTARLPDMFSSYYLECRLSAAQPQVDFLACVAPRCDEDPLRRIRAAAERPPGDLAREPAWRFAWDVIRRWVTLPQEGSRRMPCLWLEFDHVDTRPAARQSPSIWICVDPEYPAEHPSSAPWDPQDAYEGCLDFLGPAVPPGFEGLLSASNRRAMAACFRRLPPSGRIVHVSFMLAREPATIKLYGAVPRAHLVGYLRDLGWPGPLDSLQQLARTFYTAETADDTVYFDLALDHAILPYAAIAFSQLQMDRPGRSDPQRGALLGMLEEHALCAPGKRRALETWPGSARESRPSSSTRTRIHRWLDVKITLHAEQGLGAKGYLGFAPVLSVF
ncbi:hypothetical protein WME99_50770 [Sorangium sp. So ce136]|uniref:hypothetical protein n=1 Tax=Sorangium sp. So ce136 TaxID=3133284 RepID=UPI003F117A2D